MSEIIQLTETSRLRIESDQDANNPRTDGDYMMTGFVNIPNRGDSRRLDVAPIHDDPTPGLIHAMSGLDNDDALVTRWARIFHDLTVEYDSTHGGFWFVDPDELVKNFWDAAFGGQWIYANDVLTKAEVEQKIIDAERAQYEAWANGDVSGVILERRVDWARIDGNGEMVFLTEPHTMHTWEEAEALWGCYLDDVYTAQVVAREHFDLTDEEEEAAQP